MPREPHPDEFWRFHELLTESAPDGYVPWYFRVEAGAKAPALEYGSWKDASNRLTPTEAVEWMKQGGNVGIAGTEHDALVNVDIDDEDETSPDDLKLTLIARSRSRVGSHAWYFEAPGESIPNIPTDEAGEVRADWQYVVAPGSYVETDPESVPEHERENAGYYTIERADPVTSLRTRELPDVFINHLTEREQADADAELNVELPEPSEEDTSNRRSALFDITATDIVRKEGGSTDTGDRWTALFHGSDTDANMNLSSDGFIQCWRHNVTHNALQALAVLSDYSGGCAAVGTPHKGSNAGRSCLENEDGANVWYAWVYAKHNGYIPASDPVPYSAIKHTVREHDLCPVSEIPDSYDSDESLPADAYDGAIDVIETEYDIDPGRGPISSEKSAAWDGGTSTANPDPNHEPADTGESERTTLDINPSSVTVVAGLGEDGGVDDLDDRQKAACVWDLIRQSDDYHVRVRRDNATLWAYDKERGVWTDTGERALRHAARKALGSMNYGEKVLKELKTQARADPTAEAEADDFGLETGLLAVKNGLVDIDAAADGDGWGAVRDIRPDDLALARLPVAYDPDAEYDDWHSHVVEWAEDGKADALQEYVGYCLHIGAMPIHRALLLVGSGANGKGTFLHVVRAMLGENNTSSIELQTLANERDAVADFYGSVANIDDDLSARKLGAGLGMFKKLVGGDRVRARRLYESGFEFDAVGKHLYAANEVPKVNVPDSDEAFWRRWLLVEFPNHYPPHERDPDLREHLTKPEALSGVLKWTIEGRRRLLEQGHFTDEERYGQQKRERWQSWGESVDQFISECVERDPDADRITTGDAHRRYAAWCRETGVDPVGQLKFTNTMKEEDVGYKTSIQIEGSTQRGYGALGLSEEVPPLDDTPERDAPNSSSVLDY